MSSLGPTSAVRTWDSGPNWDSRSPGRPLQGLLTVLAALALVPAAAATVLRLFPPADDATALIASFIPYGLVGYLVALPLLLVALVRAARRRGLAVLAAATALATLLHVSWLVPDFVADRRPASTAGFRLLSLNVYAGQADPDDVLAASQQADVVVLVEITLPMAKELERRGWREQFPYAVGDLRTDVSDTAVYSRFPLGPGELIGRTNFQQWLTTVDVPQLGPVTLIAAHPCNPYCGGGRWSIEHRVLNAAAQANLGKRLVVAGDFNAVDDHGPMQAMRRMGLTSAVDLTGAGWLPTWPANRRFPPLIAIDHVMLDDRLTATAIRTVPVAGTDHRGLLTTIAGA